MPIYDDDPVIFDANGVQIERGMRTAAWSHGSIECPEGTVTKLLPLDVDYNDDTGRPEGYGPFVVVALDDGDEVEWDMTNDRRQWYEDEPEWDCADVEIIPGAHLGVRLPPAPPPPLTSGGGRAYGLAMMFAEWADKNGFPRVAERLRADYPF